MCNIKYRLKIFLSSQHGQCDNDIKLNVVHCVRGVNRVHKITVPQARLSQMIHMR